MLIHGETNFVLVRTLYVLDCHRRRDIRPSRLYVSPRTRLGSIGVPRRALGARKYSVGRTRIIRTRVLIEYIPRAGYIEVNESSIYVCINVLCVMRQMYTVCILYIVNCRAGSEAT